MQRDRLLILFFLIIFLTGCSSQATNLDEPSQYKDDIATIIEKDDFVLSMKTTNDQYPSSVEQISIELSNQSPESVLYGENYQLEKLEDGVWYKIPFNKEHAFVDIGYILDPEESKQVTIHILDLDYTMSKGEYRVIKSLYTQAGKQFVLGSTFTIQE